MRVALLLVVVLLVACEPRAAKPTPKEATEPAPKVEPKKPSPPRKPPAFEDEWEQAIRDVDQLRVIAEKTYKEKSRVMTVEDIALTDAILAKHNDNSPFSEAEMLVMVSHGLGDYVSAIQAAGVRYDRECKATAERIWQRSPKRRDHVELVKYMVSWSLLSDAERTVLAQIVKGERKASDAERALVLKTAGDEFWLKRP